MQTPATQRDLSFKTWTAPDIASFFGMRSRRLPKSLGSLTTFPRPSYTSSGEQRAYRAWNASEVRAWAAANPHLLPKTNNRVIAKAA